MTFEEKLDRVIILLECLLEDKARTTGFTHIETTQDVPSDIEAMATKELPKEIPTTPAPEQVSTTPQYTQNDIRQMVAHLRNKGHNASDLKELLNKNGYTAISDIADKHIDRIYNEFLSLA